MAQKSVPHLPNYILPDVGDVVLLQNGADPFHQVGPHYQEGEDVEHLPIFVYKDGVQDRFYQIGDGGGGEGD